MPNRVRSSDSTHVTTPRPWVVVTDSRGLTAEAQYSHLAGADRMSPFQLAARFSPDDLPGQFVLSRSDEAVPSGWTRHRHRGWSLGAHPWLPVATMRASDEVEVGWLLGFPIDDHAEFIEGVVRLPFASRAAPGQFEGWLYRLCGRFLAVWLSPSQERVYLDAGGTLSAVFAREHDMVASTPSLVPYTRGCDDNLDLLRAVRMPVSNAVLAFGMTSRYGVERLHPNHYLDLNHWRPRRHWPLEPLDNCADRDEAVHIVSRLIERHVVAAGRRGQVHLALTAGVDSRSILACSREHADRIKYFTLAIPDRTGRRDVATAAHLARRHGLRHQVLPHLSSTRQDLEAWLWRTGHSISDPRGWQASPSYRQLDADVEICGIAGGAARVACWRDSGSGRVRLTPRALADRLHLPHHAGILAGIRSWMSLYPANTPVEMLDGFYIEHAMGAWAGNLAYGDAHSVRCRLFPFVNRAALHAMSRLPEAYKLERRFPLDLIHHNWPELLRTPFNQRPGVHRYVDRFRRRAWLWRHALAGAHLDR